MALAALFAGCGRIGLELVPTVEDGYDAAPSADGGPFDATRPVDATSPRDDVDVETRDAGLLDGAVRDAEREEAGIDASDAGRLTDASRDADAARADADAAPAAEASVPDASLPPGLVNRYDFSGQGAAVLDRVSARHGTALGGAQLDGRGGITLDGVDDFVDLPNGLISRHQSVTVMAWLTWAGGGCWQRAFSFGTSDNGEGNAGRATSSWSLALSDCPNGFMVGMYEFNGEIHSALMNPVVSGRLIQIAHVFDGVLGQQRTYFDGVLSAQGPVPRRLSELQDVSNWLGRSHWLQDGLLQARFDELRIYDRALSAQEIADALARGPDRP